MIAVLIRPDVAIDVQIGLAATAGLRRFNVALASVEALGTMRFRAMLERHGATLTCLYGDLNDADKERLTSIAQALGAEPVNDHSGWQLLEVDVTPHLEASLREWARLPCHGLPRLELAPNRAAWLAAV